MPARPSPRPAAACSASASAWPSSSAARSASASSGRPAWSPASSRTSSAILPVWIVGGLYTLLGAVCFAELGTMLPEAGGYYVYARQAFGNTVGFAVGWTDWLTYCAVLGYVSIGIGEFVPLLLPSLAGHERAIAIALAGRLVGAAVGGRAGEQPLSAGGDGRQVLRVPGAGRRGVRAPAPAATAPRRSRASLSAADRRAAGRRDHVRRVAERAVLLRGRSRSGRATSRGR